jgi:hypothetical protein
MLLRSIKKAEYVNQECGVVHVECGIDHESCAMVPLILRKILMEEQGRRAETRSWGEEKQILKKSLYHISSVTVHLILRNLLTGGTREKRRDKIIVRGETYSNIKSFDHNYCVTVPLILKKMLNGGTREKSRNAV